LEAPRLRGGEPFDLPQVDQPGQARQPGADQRRKAPEPALLETEECHDRNQHDTGQRQGEACLDLTLRGPFHAPSSDRTRLVPKGWYDFPASAPSHHDTRPFGPAPPANSPPA